MASPSVEHAPSVDPDRLDDLVGEVRAARPQLIDAWEATALVESLGYTDGRVQREFGFQDTFAAGDYVYLLSRTKRGRDEGWIPVTESLTTIVLRSAASTMIYAVPWLTVFLVQTLRPSALSLPSRVAPALALALMFSLVASGGFVQAIVRRGEFYVGLGQFGLAREVVDALLRIGTAVTVVGALAGVLLGWYFELFEWPSLILGADAFVIMSVLWMVCGTFTIRQQQWRVAVAFVAGFAAYAAARQMGADALTAQLIAATTLLASAWLQARRLFVEGDGLLGRPAGVPLPRLAVLAYWTVPYFWYGVAYFSFLFADRLTAGTALATFAGASFGIPAPYTMGMELALLTFLVAASGVEVAGALFARAIVTEASRPFLGDPKPLAASLRRHHRRAVALALVIFVATAIAIGALATRLLPDGLTSLAWSILFAGDVGYACLAVGFVNALVLFQTRRPWTAVRALTVALFINLASGYVLSHLFGTFYAVSGLLLGAAYFAVASTIDVYRTLRRPDYTYAVG